MVAQAPPPPTVAPDSEVDAGVIEDARRRQQRHRQFGALLIAALAAGVLLAGMAAGHGGSGGGQRRGAPPTGAGPGGGAPASANTAFPGAPVTQADSYGVEADVCPLAAPDRYLPARSGCVTVRRADINGDRRPDLVIVYSTLSRKHPSYFNGEPRQLLKEFFAERAYLEVVFAGGRTVSTPIAQSIRLTHAAALDAIAHVNDDPGDEIFLEVARISSGATGVAYGLQGGRLVAAGMLSYGGDSATRAGFNCVAGNPPRLIQSAYQLIGPTIYGWWSETRTVYAWHGPKLVSLSSHTFRHHGAPRNADPGIGSGCIHGVS
ncbi:MAG TPA: hypothetical protein VG228_05765 [Solirubrobacteraceae bacterium]|jgi:hypothetical protein|nr:hypothetical protein [Solirubrobacteraceae bacterium]